MLATQQRLTELGYWLGKPDGHFGALTQQAVFALQKAAGLSRDGSVGPKTAKALADGIANAARTAEFSCPDKNEDAEKNSNQRNRDTRKKQDRISIITGEFRVSTIDKHVANKPLFIDAGLPFG